MKIIGTCPKCTRNIEQGDDVLEVRGVVYHEECAPPAEPPVEVPSQPESLASKNGGKKVKKDTRDELLEKLIGLVGSLQQEVAELKARPTASVVERPKKTKSEKGAPRPNVYYVISGFPSEKRPPQCIRVFRAIAQAAPAPAEGAKGSRMTEMDIWNALMAEPFPSTKPNPRLGAWNHVQTPFYIFKYYRADMIDAEYVQGPFDAV